MKNFCFIKRLAGVALTAVLSAGCSLMETEPLWKKAVEGDGPGRPDLVVNEPLQVMNLPKSRSGNRSVYEVFGVQYAVLESARNFKEQGVASWYGIKFHGNHTASGEIYDMYRLTAAHKHLPIPTFVRVTRQDNGNSIVVKVNDRGPFVGDRIIDLSYGAASALDMLDSGKTRVTIEALSHHEVEENEPKVIKKPVKPVVEEAVDRSVEIELASSEAKNYVQVGAFAELDNAKEMMKQVLQRTSLPSRLDFLENRGLYQVRVGPFYDDSVVQNVLTLLASHGFEGYRSPVVAES